LIDRAILIIKEEDWNEMSGRLRSRVGRLMRQLDAGAGVRDQIEKDLEKRIGEKLEPRASVPTNSCAACDTTNDPDAKFCKGCGQPLVAR
jgi:hypothetical protein